MSVIAALLRAPSVTEPARATAAVIPAPYWTALALAINWFADSVALSAMIETLPPVMAGAKAPSAKPLSAGGTASAWASNRPLTASEAVLATVTLTPPACPLYAPPLLATI